MFFLAWRSCTKEPVGKTATGRAEHSSTVCKNNKNKRHLAFETGSSEWWTSEEIQKRREQEQRGEPLAMQQGAGNRDPVVNPTNSTNPMDSADAIFGDPYEAVDRADALLILTAWPQYTTLGFRYVGIGAWA